MLYFAYGSNLNHLQMKRRCKDSCFIKSMSLKGYVLTFRSRYGAADIERKKKSKVLGALYEISRSDEKQLDIYEDYPIVYKKMYFQHCNKKVMTYIMQKKTRYKNPNTRYLNIILQGYKDCKLDEKYLNRALKPSW